MKNELNVATAAAKKAGEIILQYYKSKYEIRDKSFHNPVTTADHASDAYLKQTLCDNFPDYGWLSEETVDSYERLEKSHIWVVDPLDGTKEFIEGVPHFVISIALVEQHEPILGILYNPVTDELFTAVKNKGAFFNGEQIHCSLKSNLKDMTILNSRSETRRGLWDPFMNEFKELRAVGSVAYKLGLTAAGEADIFASLRPKNEWDICAGHCIVREAGGELKTIFGKPVQYNQKTTLIEPGITAGAIGALNTILNLFNMKN
ncbi:3'(2'),5'-bisphosphate nucleotidase CysQ [Candidatus Neomarinimicrobiota bacterium]